MATGTRLYVGNLSFHTSEDALREAFEQDGRKVVEVKLITDRETGQPRGFGFVEMGTSADAAAAIEAWNGQQLDGRALKVNEAQERPGGGGGGGGGGRGGGGGGATAVAAAAAATVAAVVVAAVAAVVAAAVVAVAAAVVAAAVAAATKAARFT